LEASIDLSSISHLDGRGVRVGVIDSVMFRNPQLSDRFYVLESSSLLPDGADEYFFLNGHGTFVTGQILKRAPAAKLEIRGVLNGPNSTATVWEVAKAMASFLSIGIGVINLSIGCYTRDAQPPFVLERAVDVLSSHGVVLLAAAGNHGKGSSTTIPRNAPIFPAACPGAIAVGALTAHEDGAFCRAPYSPTAQWVNLVAPGTSVTSTYLSGKVKFPQLAGLSPAPEPEEFHGTASWTGTSFATAAVSGEIAKLTVPGETTPLQALNTLLHRDPRTHGNDGIGKYLAEIPVCTDDEQQD
jgi:subtilisin family serine protease